MPPFHALQRTNSDGDSYWVTFSDELETVEAFEIKKVLPTLRKLEEAQSKGIHAIGWIAYEAAPAFDPGLFVHPKYPNQPLLRFTLYKTQTKGLPFRETSPFSFSKLRPGLTEKKFTESVSKIHHAIAAGETYQVNFTYPMHGTFTGDSWDVFRKVRLAQSAQHQAYFEETDQTILCLSPERFFKHQGSQITCKPMKGTARPGEENHLRTSAKDRAENIMIVDMIRNDLGKIANKGTVKTPSLYDVESHPSVVQMTSTVTADGSPSPVDWLCALFPCASITGAPKKKTMEWITRLESGPRGIYTGCIGGFYGDGVTELNVAIRTATLQPQTKTYRYHIGCGIVWDSKPGAEYRESILKSAVLSHKTEPFSLIETMRWEPKKGVELWPYHKKRLIHSAACLGFEVDPHLLDAEISSLHFPNVGKVRLSLSDARKMEIVYSELPESTRSLRFRIDSRPTPSTHPELKHKTTRRDIYKHARQRQPDVEETLLINERGELMEFCIGNLVWKKNDMYFTPPKTSGLLPGVAREKALDHGDVVERVCFPKELETADKIYLINALRGWVNMKFVP